MNITGAKGTYTSDVDDDIRVGELGHGLGNDSLATAESAWNGDGATLDGREEGVQHTLTDDEGSIGRLLLGCWTRHPHRPCLHHAVLGLLAIELDLEDLLVDGVVALVGNPGDGSTGARWEENLVDGNEGVLEDSTPDVTTGDVVTDAHRGCELPLLGAVESGDMDTTRDVDAVGVLGDLLEGSLNTIVDVVEQAGAELDGEGLSGSQDGVSYRDTGCWLVPCVSTATPPKGCGKSRGKVYLFPRRPGWWPDRY